MSLINEIKEKEFTFKIPRDRAILLACMVISLIFWILIKLSQEYRTEKIVPIVYILPEAQAFTNMPPSIITANIKGQGWDLMYEYFMNGEARAEFDLSSTNSDINRVELEDQIHQMLSSPSIEVITVSEEYINLSLEEKREKKVPIVLHKNLSFAPGYQLGDTTRLVPDSLVVSGPKSLVDSVKFWFTKELIGENLKKDVQQSIPLVLPKQNVISINPTFVDVMVQVEQLTEKSMFVPVLVKNAPDSIKIFPDKIRLNATVGLSDYNTVTKEGFVVEVDLANVAFNSENNTIPILLTKQPEAAKSVYFSPKSVEYFIVKSVEKKKVEPEKE